MRILLFIIRYCVQPKRQPRRSTVILYRTTPASTQHRNFVQPKRQHQRSTAILYSQRPNSTQHRECVQPDADLDAAPRLCTTNANLDAASQFRTVDASRIFLFSYLLMYVFVAHLYVFPSTCVEGLLFSWP